MSVVFKKLFDDARKSPEYWAAGLHLEICEAICDEMRRQKIGRAELARRVGVNRSAVTRWLGDSNLCLVSIAKMCMALDLELRVEKR